MLDDPLSAVDSIVANHIFEECFEKLCADKLRILVTHQTKFLPRTNQILVMDEGKILHSGSYEQLVEQGLLVFPHFERNHNP